MSSASLTADPDTVPFGLVAPAAPSSRAVRGLLLVLVGALLLVVLYAAFDHGGVALAGGARVEVASAAIAAVAAAGAIALSALRLSAPRIALTGLVLLLAFAGWSAVTLIWSVAPDQTWIEFNRVIAYALVLAVAMAIGASAPRASAVLANGFLAVALIVTAYALGQKLIPGVHVAGLFDLNQTGAIPRLQAPIGYWNALALFVVLGVPVALQQTIDSRRSVRGRLAAACALELMLLVIGLTLSRGGLLALVVAVLVGVAGARDRVRALAWLVLVALATVPPLLVGLTSHSLTAAGVALATRERAGGVLAAVLIASLVGLVLAGTALQRFESRLRLGPSGSRRARRLGLATVGVLVVGGLLAASLTHAWSGFFSPSAPSNVSPNRLLTTDSYRWLWWKEAASAFAARPLGGWGAGSFGVVHLIYRHNTLPVQQPHGVPLQFLSETGIVGGLLGLGALSLLAIAAVRSARRAGADRGFAFALLAASLAYLVHLLYDWDWNIPAVTIPALTFLGVLAGANASAPRRWQAALRDPPAAGSRVLALTGLTVWLACFGLSAALPSLAASQANAALVQAAGSAPAALKAAQAKARLASRLDPLSDAGLRAEASIAIHHGQLARARYYLQEAVGREPSDELAWNQLAQVDAFIGDRIGARQAARRMLALDPRGPSAQAIRSSGLVRGG